MKGSNPYRVNHCLTHDRGGYHCGIVSCSGQTVYREAGDCYIIQYWDPEWVELVRYVVGRSARDA